MKVQRKNFTNFIYNYCFPFGRTIAHAVSGRLPTAAAQARAHVNVVFVVDKVTLEQILSEYFGSPANFHSTDCSKLSSGGGTVGQLVSDLPSGSVSPHLKK
jgi:hypothetical protein